MAARALLAALLTLPLAAGADMSGRARPGQIGLWAPPAPVPGGGADATACLAAIAQAERTHDVPDHHLLAIGFTEAGRTLPDGVVTVWPWTVTAEGDGRYFSTKSQAIARVRELQSQGVRSIDVGCMQVNLRWHPDAFPDLETAFDPTANTAYASSFLAQLAADAGWEGAVGRYHSFTPDKRDAYAARAAANRRFIAAALKAVADARPASGGTTHAPGGALVLKLNLFADNAPRPLLPELAPGGR